MLDDDFHIADNRLQRLHQRADPWIIFMVVDFDPLDARVPACPEPGGGAPLVDDRADSESLHVLNSSCIIATYYWSEVLLP